MIKRNHVHTEVIPIRWGDMVGAAAG